MNADVNDIILSGLPHESGIHVKEMYLMPLTLLPDLHKKSFTTSDYTIIKDITKDKILLRIFPGTKESVGESDTKPFLSGKIPTADFLTDPENPEQGTLILTDTDDRISFWKERNVPVIAWSHENNSGESLLHTPWLILSPEALTYEYLQEVYHRFYHLPLEILRTDRCRLRELVPDDLPALLALDREQVSGSAGRFFPEDEEFPDEFLSSYIRTQYPFYGYGIYAASHKETGEFLGIAGFYPPASEGSSVEIGYTVRKSVWRQGYAGEWIRGLTRYAMESLEQKEVIARIPASNEASLRAAFSAGGVTVLEI